MTSAETIPDVRSQRPKRADARRNYDKLIAAAREAFTEEGGSASLEEIARRAGVGIGTLYRNFPTRQDLLEAVYVEEVEAVCRTAEELMGDPPWEALVAWLHRFLDYVATKQALSQELFSHLGRDADVFRGCRTAFYAAGDRLLVRAQEAGDGPHRRVDRRRGDAGRRDLEDAVDLARADPPHPRHRARGAAGAGTGHRRRRPLGGHLTGRLSDRSVSRSRLHPRRLVRRGDGASRCSGRP